MHSCAHHPVEGSLNVSRHLPQLIPSITCATSCNRDGRHEYVNGRVYALSGGTIAHAQLVANVFGAASERLAQNALSGAVPVHAGERRVLTTASTIPMWLLPASDAGHPQQPSVSAVLHRRGAVALDSEHRQAREAYRLHLARFTAGIRAGVSRPDASGCVPARRRQAGISRSCTSRRDTVPMSCLEGADLAGRNLSRSIDPAAGAEGFDEDDDEEWLRIAVLV